MHQKKIPLSCFVIFCPTSTAEGGGGRHPRGPLELHDSLGFRVSQEASNEIHFKSS